MSNTSSRDSPPTHPPLSVQVILDTLGLAGQIKKTPVVVGNCTGFAVNRVFFPYTMAACLLADLGQNPYEVRGVGWGWRRDHRGVCRKR